MQTWLSSVVNRLPLGQSEDLSHGRDGSMEHILNLPLDRRDISYYDKVLLSKKLYLEEFRSCSSMEVYWVSSPFQSWD